MNSEGQNSAISRWSAMVWLLRLTGSVTDVAGRTMPAKLGLFVLCAYLFLWVPDLNLLLLSILHHRSIMTHSLIPGLLLLIFGRKLGAAPLAGAFIGLSVHLTCDMLSPMVGYGQVWLPAPFKAPLGPLSYLWLGINAVLGFALASLIARKSISIRFGYLIVVICATVTGVSYGALNEGSVLSVVVVLVMVFVSLWPEGYLRRRAARMTEMASE